MSIDSDPTILILTHEFFPKRGGIATYTEEIAQGAANIGQQVEVWAPNSAALSNHRFPFPVREVNLKGSQDFTCQINLVREWRRNRETIQNAVVHLTDPGPILAMRFLQFSRSSRPRKLVLTFHGSEIIRFSRNRFSKFLISKVIQKCDRINVLSQYTCSLLEKHFPQSKPKILVTPGALRSGFRIPEAKEKKTTHPLVILTVGRLHPRKGQAETLDALSALPEPIRRGIEFWIVGSGLKFGYSKALKRKANYAGFRVKFFGSVSDEKLQRLYSKADIFSLTSVNFRKSVEGYGLVYLEAAAHGLPIVANRVGGVSEAVSHMENGILVKPHDNKALTEAFNQLIQDKALRKRMGDQGRAWSLRHNWNQIAKDLYDGLDS